MIEKLPIILSSTSRRNVCGQETLKIVFDSKKRRGITKGNTKGKFRSENKHQIRELVIFCYCMLWFLQKQGFLIIYRTPFLTRWSIRKYFSPKIWSNLALMDSYFPFWPHFETRDFFPLVSRKFFKRNFSICYQAHFLIRSKN